MEKEFDECEVDYYETLLNFNVSQEALNLYFGIQGDCYNNACDILYYVRGLRDFEQLYEEEPEAIIWR